MSDTEEQSGMWNFPVFVFTTYVTEECSDGMAEFMDAADLETSPYGLGLQFWHGEYPREIISS